MAKKQLNPVAAAPTRVEVTNENALRLSCGMLDTLVQQNKAIITLLGSIATSVSQRVVTDLGGPSGTINCDNKQ